ncbi:hypothetical protein ABPG74_003686 [Tetrahymena malaccensis]
MKNKRVQQASSKDYELVVNLLQKKEKSQRDLETIYNKISLLNGFNLFIQNYFYGSDISEQIKICGELVYEKKNKGDVIFYQDEPSNNKLYIILKGSCMLFLLKDLDFQEEEEEQPNVSAQNQDQQAQNQAIQNELQNIPTTMVDRIKQIGQKFKKQVSFDFDQHNLTQREINDLKKRYGKTTRLLQAGSIFGERALFTNQARTATILADSHPTEMVILDRDKFLPALEELKKTLQLRRDILFQIFKDMDNYSSARLENMLYSFSVLSFNRGHYITEQNQHDDKFYIIAEGEAQILKKIPIQINEFHQEERVAKLTIIGPGVMVGDEIMLKGEQRYLYTTEVISIKAQVLVADKKIIDRKFPKDLKDYLKKVTINKEKGRQILLQHKEEEIKQELMQQLKKETSKKLLSTQYKHRSEEEAQEVLKKMKDAISNRQHFTETLPQNQNQSIDEQLSSQRDILRGNVPLFTKPNQQQQQPQQEKIQSSFLLPAITEKNNQNFKEENITSSLSLRLINLAPGQQNNIFDVKSQVFDFGDGKNIQNAQRIEKILNAKNKKKKDGHFSGNNATVQQQLEKNALKQVQQDNNLMSNIVTDMQNIHSYANQSQKVIKKDFEYPNNKSDADKLSMILSSDKRGSYSTKHLRNISSEYINGFQGYHNNSISLIQGIGDLGKGTTQLPLIKSNDQLKLKEQKQLKLELIQENLPSSIIHSSKNKYPGDDQQSKVLLKKPIKVVVSSNNNQKSNSSQFLEAQVLGTLHLSPTRIQKFQLETIQKQQQNKKKYNKFTNNVQTVTNEFDQKNQINKHNANSSLQNLTIDDDINSTNDIQISITAINQQEFQNKKITNNISLVQKQNENICLANDKKTLAQESLNQKIKQLDNINPQENIFKEEEPKSLNSPQQFNDKIRFQEINQINTPIRKELKSNEAGESTTCLNSDNSSQNKVSLQTISRHASSFFPITIPKPNKIINQGSRTLSMKKIVQQKSDLYSSSIFKNPVNLQQNYQQNNLQKDLSINLFEKVNTNKLDEYFSVISYNKALKQQKQKNQNNNKKVLS